MNKDKINSFTLKVLLQEFKCSSQEIEDGMLNSSLLMKVTMSYLIITTIGKVAYEDKRFYIEEATGNEHVAFEIGGCTVVVLIGQPDSLWWKKEDEEQLLYYKN